MKITIFTVTDCEFSKKEIEYLKSHNLQYEEKNLETNKEFLTEMLAISDNFAGTPVTRIEKDDGQIAVLKGFTQDEFDVALGFKKQEETTTPEAKDEVVAASSTPTDTTSQQPVVPEPPPIAPVVEPPPTPAVEPPTAPIETPPPPAPEPPTIPPVVETPPVVTPAPSTSQTDEKLASVLGDLKSRSEVTQTPVSPPPAPPANMPSIPEPTFK